MKAWKKVLSYAVSAAMVIALTPVTSVFAAESGNSSSTATTTVKIAEKNGDELVGEGVSAARYRIIDANDKTVTYVSCESNEAAAEVPNKVTLSDGETYTVVAIGAKAFYGKTKLTMVDIAKSVGSIGDRAFEECVNLKSVVVREGLKSIGTDAFFYCTRLDTFPMPSTVTEIGKGAFFGCSSLESVDIPAGVSIIRNYTFAKCSSLKIVDGCSGLTTINARAFKECTSLTTIALPKSLTKIASRAFYGCESLSSITLPSSLKTIGIRAFSGCYSMDNITLSCKTVPVSAFENCSKLSHVTFGANVATISANAFKDAGLKKVVIGKGVTKVDATAFSSNTVTSFAVTKGNTNFSAVKGVLYKGKTLVCYPCGMTAKTYTVPKGTTAIGANAFARNDSLTKVVIQKGVKKIGASAFNYDSELKQITLPNSLKTLGASVFENSGIESITIPAKVTAIPAGAFNGCYRLKTVKMTSVKTIGSRAFQDCGETTTLALPKSVKTFSGDATIGSSIKKITVAKGSKSLKSVNGVLFNAAGTKLICYPNGKTAKTYTVPSKTKIIGAHAFERCSLRTVKLPTSVTSIYKYAFFDCVNLGCLGTGFKIPASVENIGAKAIGYTNGNVREEQLNNMLILCAADSEAESYAVDADIAYASSQPALTTEAIALTGAGSTAKMVVSNAYTDTFKFYSSDKTVATVDKNGVVTAVGAGSTYIVAAMGTYYLKCKVTVDGAGAASSQYSNYKEVATQSDLSTWESEHYAANKNASFSAKDNPAIRCYTGDEFVPILAVLGNESYAASAESSYGADIEEYGEIADCLAWELSKYTLQSDTEFFSGVDNLDDFTNAGSTLSDMEASIGSTTYFDEMISTSLNEGVAVGFGSGPYKSVLHVYAPAGAVAGGYLFKFSKFPAEYEYLLSQGARFKVVDAGVRYSVTTTYGASYSEECYERYCTLEYVGAPGEAVASSGEKLNILSTNDVHCAVDYNPTNNVMGYAGLAKLLTTAKNTYGADKVALVDSGDAIQGGSLGTLSQGKAIIDLMNTTGYNASALGNHEFDYGADTLKTLTSAAAFPYVSCNFKYATGANKGTTVYEPYTIQQLGSKKVAFVGITTPTTLNTTKPGNLQDSKGNTLYDFCNDSDGSALYKQVQKSVNAARAAGADYVVALGHIGQTATQTYWRSDAIVENTTGIDFFLDGHSHQTYIQTNVKNKLGQVVPITQAGTKLSAAGSIVLDTATNTATISVVEASSVKSYDATVDTAVKAQESAYAAQLNTVVGSSTADLVCMDSKGTWLARNAETNLGDLVADALRDATGADAALLNGGGVRANLKAGSITLGGIMDTLPYQNSVSSVEITGQQILDALELGVVNYPSMSGGFMQVSGVTYEINSAVKTSPVSLDSKGNFVEIKSGDRRVENATIGGKAIDPAKTYTVAMADFLTAGGDGFTMLKDCKVVKNSVCTDTDALVNYIKSTLKGTVGSSYAAAGGQGRIVIK